ncbi:hypothetical protein AIOL_003481 [Candidatus Rhodobacter oscarellae]|uniref:Cytochrome b561 domain-containing protein n=1 Tax=Candidatus Rhodobacter oscarellae TaxID=1675527 RepID=A0A0J9E739_9RHOB|nr:cytochrome b561 domain-containing protein [Candidatus Rhodobacter lobularis]KMW58506.1 hypothetical protein AIOL_003481 [Candidatus Rhodobacter lobularis]
MEWLLAPIDPTRAHEVGFAISWHGRAMVLAWGGLAPLAVLAARFFKVLPGQDWPRELDSQAWWRAHWIGQSLVLGLTVFALALVLPQRSGAAGAHGWLGYAVLVCLAAQVLLGVLRGSKGGPTAPAPDGSPRGDHFDMTRWRLIFEHAHKSLGYLTLVLAAVAILYGMWAANAPRWMWIGLLLWWVLLLALSAILQRRGWAVDTYQAIWGDDPSLPGNRRKIGWGMRRPNESKEGDGNVRSDRGNGV